MTSAVMEAIASRRSIRKYTKDLVSDAEILTILEAGRAAPSGKNNQPWRFLVVRSGDERQKRLAEHTKYAHIVESAAVSLCVFLDKTATYNRTKDCQSIGACLQNILLAVHDLGLGAVWLGEIINQEPDVTTSLGLDENALELMAVVTIGHPDTKGASSRKPLSELLLEPLTSTSSEA